MTTRVTVTPVTGSGPYGDTFGAPTPVMCWPQEESVLVRSTTGEETVSGTRLWTTPDHFDLFAPGSAVVIRDRSTEVITRSLHSPGALSMDALLEVALR